MFNKKSAIKTHILLFSLCSTNAESTTSLESLILEDKQQQFKFITELHNNIGEDLISKYPIYFMEKYTYAYPISTSNFRKLTTVEDVRKAISTPDFLNMLNNLSPDKIIKSYYKYTDEIRSIYIGSYISGDNLLQISNDGIFISNKDVVIPSFDCSKKLFRVEHEICEKNDLSLLDIEISTLYGALDRFLTNNDFYSIKLRQKKYIEKRNSCQKENDIYKCTLNIMTKIKEELESDISHLEKSKIETIDLNNKMLHEIIGVWKINSYINSYHITSDSYDEAMNLYLNESVSITKDHFKINKKTLQKNKDLVVDFSVPQETCLFKTVYKGKSLAIFNLDNEDIGYRSPYSFKLNPDVYIFTTNCGVNLYYSVDGTSKKLHLIQSEVNDDIKSNDIDLPLETLKLNHGFSLER